MKILKVILVIVIIVNLVIVYLSPSEHKIFIFSLAILYFSTLIPEYKESWIDIEMNGEKFNSNSETK